VRPAPAAEAAFPIPTKPGLPPEVSGRHPEITVSGPDAQGHLSIKRVAPARTFLVKDIGTTLSGHWNETLDIREGDPNSCIWTQQVASGWKRGDWDCTILTDCEISSTVDEFHLKESVRAKKGGKLIFEREKVSVIKRDLI